ncbi:hypothetical protein ASF23_05500 [Curtobacterium sp. Leaf261]|nr:hypothetical protein ASF23_05500 [Curtobacterium sp. Leaf261]
MPFTVSHTIVALPFRRTAIPAAALAVGSMAPDAVLFVPALPPYGVTHSALGALSVSLPVALVVLLVWTFGLRWAWTAIQPRPVHERLPPSWDDPLSAWRTFVARTPGRRVGDLALTLGTVIAGIYSHIAWDSFTHSRGWSVARIPALRTDVAGHPLYDWIQNACSFGGMVVLAIAFALWFRRTAPTPRGREVSPHSARRIRVTLLVVLVVVTAVGASPLLLIGAGPTGVLGWAAILAIRVAAVLLVGTAVALGVREVVRTRRRSG